jgi:hypothetical protein
MPPNASAPAAAASMPVKNNGFGPVIKHMDTLKELLDKLSAKLRGVSPNNGLGTNPLEAIQVNIPPQAKARGNGLGNNPLGGIQVNIPQPNMRNQHMRVAQNAAAAAAQKRAAHNLSRSNMLGNAARNKSKQEANMRAKTEGKGPSGNAGKGASGNAGKSGNPGNGASGISAENQYAATKAGLNHVTPGNVGKEQQTSKQGQPNNNQKVSVKNRKAAIEAKLKKTRKNRKSSRKNTRRN